MSSLFYGPGDWLAAHSSARTRRALGAWCLIFFFGPGFLFWILLLNALWYVGFMSLVALWLTAWTIVGTETPVEAEDTTKGAP